MLCLTPKVELFSNRETRQGSCIKLLFIIIFFFLGLSCRTGSYQFHFLQEALSRHSYNSTRKAEIGTTEPARRQLPSSCDVSMDGLNSVNCKYKPSTNPRALANHYRVLPLDLQDLHCALCLLLDALHVSSFENSFLGCSSWHAMQ